MYGAHMRRRCPMKGAKWRTGNGEILKSRKLKLLSLPYPRYPRHPWFKKSSSKFVEIREIRG
jgi:hypothetical protein